MSNKPLSMHERSGMVRLVWASKASPALGCSIETSRDICRYVGMNVSLSTKNTYAKTRLLNYVAQTRVYSKSVLGAKTDP